MHFVVSDIHGHVEPFVGALHHAKLLDSDGAWCGGGARLTILGDFFDRGPDGIAVVDLIRRLQDEAGAAGGQVDALLGNHEILALGMHRYADQHIAWLSGLDAIVLAGRDLLLHTDTTEYLRWGDSVERINDAMRHVLAGDGLGEWWECWVRLTARYAFADSGGERVAVGVLDRLGGERVVHGHSIIASLTGQDSTEVTGPLSYAGGRALAIDGGIYAGGPCLVVRLDHDRAATT